MASMDASRWMTLGGRNDASAACASAQRTHTNPAPWRARITLGNAAPARETAASRSLDAREEGDSRWFWGWVSSTTPMRMPEMARPRDATSRSTSGPMHRSALSPFGQSAMPVPTFERSSVARS